MCLELVNSVLNDIIQDPFYSLTLIQVHDLMLLKDSSDFIPWGISISMCLSSDPPEQSVVGI